MFTTYRCTLLVVLVSTITLASPSWTHALQLDWSMVGDGQWWRLWTGHTTHYGHSHWFWDTLMFAALSGVCERRHRTHYGIVLAVMMLSVSVAVGAFCEDIGVYRGLSGIDTGLFVWFALDQITDAWRSRPTAPKLGRVTFGGVTFGGYMLSWDMLGWMLALVGLIGKLVYEAISGDTLFVDSGNFRPLVEAHLAGAAMGLMSWTLPFYSGRRDLDSAPLSSTNVLHTSPHHD